MSEVIRRVTRRPNLDVCLSPSGFEPYADKRERIDDLLREGERAEREDMDYYPGTEV